MRYSTLFGRDKVFGKIIGIVAGLLNVEWEDGNKSKISKLHVNIVGRFSNFMLVGDWVPLLPNLT